MNVRLPSKLNRSTAYLVGLVILLGGGNLLWTAHAVNSAKDQAQHATQVAIDVNNHQWCSSLGVLLSSPKPTAQQPATLKLYNDFIVLTHKFGCDN